MQIRLEVHARVSSSSLGKDIGVAGHAVEHRHAVFIGCAVDGRAAGGGEGELRTGDRRTGHILLGQLDVELLRVEHVDVALRFGKREHAGILRTQIGHLVGVGQIAKAVVGRIIRIDILVDAVRHAFEQAIREREHATLGREGLRGASLFVVVVVPRLPLSVDLGFDDHGDVAQIGTIDGRRIHRIEAVAILAHRVGIRLVAELEHADHGVLSGIVHQAQRGLTVAKVERVGTVGVADIPGRAGLVLGQDVFPIDQAIRRLAALAHEVRVVEDPAYAVLFIDHVVEAKVHVEFVLLIVIAIRDVCFDDLHMDLVAIIGPAVFHCGAGLNREIVAVRNAGFEVDQRICTIGVEHKLIYTALREGQVAVIVL